MSKLLHFTLVINLAKGLESLPYGSKLANLPSNKTVPDPQKGSNIFPPFFIKNELFKKKCGMFGKSLAV